MRREENMKRVFQIVRTAPSPDQVGKFWGIGQRIGPIGPPIVVDDGKRQDEQEEQEQERP